MDAQKGRITMLRKAVSSFLKPVKRVAESGSEVSVKSRETRECFLVIILYFCDTSDAKDMSDGRHGAESQQPCPKCHCVQDGLLMGRRSVGRVVAKTMQTLVKARKLARKDCKPGEKGHSRE